MKGKILIIIILFSSQFALSQAGYFGGMEGFELKTSLIPSIRNVHAYNEGTNQMIIRPRIAHINYHLNYFKYSNRNGEMAFGLRYSRVRFHSEGQLVTQKGQKYTTGYGDKYITNPYVLIEDPKANYIGLTFSRKYYLSGIAAAGFYLGWNLELGVGVFDSKEVYLGNVLDQADENVFSTTVNVTNVNKLTHLDESYSLSANALLFATGATIGKAFPLTNQLVLNIGIRIPVLSYVSTNSNDGENASLLFFNDPNEEIEVSDSRWGIPFAYSLLKYNGVGLDVGLKWHHNFKRSTVMRYDN